MNYLDIKNNEQIKPLKDTLWITNLQHGLAKKGYVFIPDDNMKKTGIKPRYAQIYAVADNLKDIFKVGEWVLIDHGNWTRAMYIKGKDNKDIEVHLVPKASVYRGIKIITDKEPEDKSTFAYKY